MGIELLINPKGRMEHNHKLRAKVNNCERDQLERLIGPSHSDGEDNKVTAEWYMITPHGSVTIRDWWALNEGEYQILCANDEVAAQVVDYFKNYGIQAFRLTGKL